jgi:hypothetical protein
VRNRHSSVSHTNLRLLAILLFTLVVTGCGGAATCPIRGRVVFKDTNALARELVGYVVTFELVDGDVSASGVVERDGTFEVSTYELGDGAVPGRHRVALNAPMSHELIEGPGAAEAARLIPDKYGSPTTSGLEITVKSSGQEVELAVERAGN